MAAPIPSRQRQADPEARKIYLSRTSATRADAIRLRWEGEWGPNELTPVQGPFARISELVRRRLAS